MRPDLLSNLMTTVSLVKYLTHREVGATKKYVHEKEYGIGNIGQQVTEEKATIPSKNQACEFSGQTRSTFLMTFSPDGSLMASTHGDHAVRVTDLSSGKCIHTLSGHPRTPWCVAFHPVSNDILASGCLGGEVRIWDLRGGGSEVWKSDKNVSIASIAFHPMDQVLVFAVANEVHFWDWTEPEPFATISTAFEYEKVRWVRFDPHGYYLFTGIGNGVSVCQNTTEESEVSMIGQSSSRHSSEERAQLQNQYRRILEEIHQLRRERLQNEMQRGARRSGEGAAASASDTTSSERTEAAGAESSVSVPRSPSPVHVDALVNARLYASAVTQAQQAHSQPATSNLQNNHRRSLQAQLREMREQGMARRANRLSMNPFRDLPTPGESAAQPNVTIITSTATARAPMSSMLSSFLRSQLTSSAEATIVSATTTVSSTSAPSMFPQSNTVQPVTVLSVAQSSHVGGTTSTLSTTVRAQLASAFRSQTQTYSTRSTGVVSTPRTSTVPSGSIRGRFINYLNSTANATNQEEHFECSSGRCQVCQRYPSLPQSQSTWSSSPRTVPILPRRVSRSTNGRDSPPGQRSKQTPRKMASVLETEVKKALDQVRARRLDISETLRDLDNLRQELGGHGNERPIESSSSSVLAGLQGESSTSEDRPHLSSSQEEIISSTPRLSRQRSNPDTSNQEPTPSTSGNLFNLEEDDDVLLTSSQESNISEVSSEVDSSLSALLLAPDIDPRPMDLRSDNATALPMDFGPTPGSPTDDPELDNSSQGSSSSTSSLGSMESLPSSQEDTAASPQVEATLIAIGQYSSEIERRVQELDRRISEIQNRLQNRLQSLQQHRERQPSRTSTVPRCVSVSERIRRRHERLRAHLDELQRRYQQRTRVARERRQWAERSQTDRPEQDQGSQSPPADVTEASTEPPAAPSSLRGVRNITSSRRLWSENIGDTISNMRADMARNRQSRREYYRSWHSLQRRHLHPHYSVSILDETVNRPEEGLQSAINRAIAGAFVTSGENSVASNILNASYRIQRWEFSRGSIPDIRNSEDNVIVPHCKLHNDAYCDLSKDGRFLAVFVPSHNGFPDDNVLGVYSLAHETFKQCLFTKSFGPNFVSVSISPLNNYILVGLATRRLAWVFASRQMVAQVYKVKTPFAGEDSMEHVCDLMHPCDMDIRTPVSVNSARWLPYVGEGIVYGTNRGDLHICRPGFEQEEKRNNDTDSQQEPSNVRPTWMMHMLGLNVPRTTTTSTQTIQRVRRTASTQTDRIENEEAT